MNIDSPSISVPISRIWEQKMLMQAQTSRRQSTAGSRRLVEPVYDLGTSEDRLPPSHQLAGPTVSTCRHRWIPTCLPGSPPACLDANNHRRAVVETSVHPDEQRERGRETGEDRGWRSGERERQSSSIHTTSGSWISYLGGGAGCVFCRVCTATYQQPPTANRKSPKVWIYQTSLL